MGERLTDQQRYVLRMLCNARKALRDGYLGLDLVRSTAMMRRLERRGLVQVRRRNDRNVYRITDNGMRALQPTPPPEGETR